MIHRHRADPPPALARPAIGKNGEGEAVGTAGDGDGKKRAALEWGERGERSRELVEGKGFREWRLDQQPSRFFSATARSLIAFPGFGKS